MTANQVTVWTPELSVGGVEQDFKNLAEAHKAVHWDAEKNYAIQLLRKSDFSVKTAQSNPVSVQNAVKNIAAIGLTLNPALKYAYLVPRDGQICLDVSYMGLMHLAQETGSVTWAQCKLVHEADTYMNSGVDKQPEHNYQAFSERGAIQGAYCTVKLLDGDYLTHEMPIADIYAIRDRSQAWKKNQSGPWKTDEKEMIKKTVVKQASKYWPKVDRMHQAIEVLNTESGEGIEFESENRGYTDKQAEKFRYYLSEGSDIEFFGYFNLMPVGVSDSLYSSFPSGEKVRGKKLVTEKSEAGRKEIMRLIAMAESDDEETREGALEGLSDIERKVLAKWKRYIEEMDEYKRGGGGEMPDKPELEQES